MYFDSPAKLTVSQVSYRTAWVSVELGEENKGLATQMKFRLLIGDKVVSQYPVNMYRDLKMKLRGMVTVCQPRSQA